MLSAQPLGFPRAQTLTAEERHAEPGVPQIPIHSSNQVVEVLLADLRKRVVHFEACDPRMTTGGHRGGGRFTELTNLTFSRQEKA